VRWKSQKLCFTIYKSTCNLHRKVSKFNHSRRKMLSNWEMNILKYFFHCEDALTIIASIDGFFMSLKSASLKLFSKFHLQFSFSLNQDGTEREFQNWYFKEITLEKLNDWKKFHSVPESFYAICSTATECRVGASWNCDSVLFARSLWQVRKLKWEYGEDRKIVFVMGENFPSSFPR
jgi:hypothetical protein